MRAVIIAMCGVLAVAMSPATEAREHRSAAVLAEFQRQYPCPSTGITRPLCRYRNHHRHCERCPGYVIDHVFALCKGGPDVVENLEWQTIAAAKAKDKWECK